MIFETNRGLMAERDLIDELVYINYSANRETFPHLSPERYAMAFPNAAALEERYQAEKRIAL